MSTSKSPSNTEPRNKKLKITLISSNNSLITTPKQINQQQGQVPILQKESGLPKQSPYNGNSQQQMTITKPQRQIQGQQNQRCQDNVNTYRENNHRQFSGPHQLRREISKKIIMKEVQYQPLSQQEQRLTPIRRQLLSQQKRQNNRIIKPTEHKQSISPIQIQMCCLCKQRQQKEFITLPCGHTYHKDCLKQFIQEN